MAIRAEYIMKKSFLLLLTFLFAVSQLSFAQTSKSKSSKKKSKTTVNPCFSLPELQSLMHKDPLEVSDIVSKKGYSISVGDVCFDTIVDDLTNSVYFLKYKKVPFLDNNNSNSGITVYFSEDSLDNIVLFTRCPAGKCTVDPMSLAEDGYDYNPETGVVRVLLDYKKSGTPDTLEYSFSIDSNCFKLRLQNISDIGTYLNNQRNRIRVDVSRRLEYCKNLVDLGNYSAAIVLLESLKGRYRPLDDSIAASQNDAVARFDKYWFSELERAANVNDNVQLAIDICDTLLLYSDFKDSVANIRSVLAARLSGGAEKFSDVFPSEFDSILSDIELLVNDDIYSNVSTDMQRLSLAFTFHTYQKNESFGLVSLEHDNLLHPELQQQVEQRQRRLQYAVDSFAASPIIKPLQRSGVYVVTDEQVNADIRWHYYTMQVIDSCNVANMQLKPFVDWVEDRYFTKYDTSRASVSRKYNEVVVRKIVRKPTRNEYTFGITEKYLNDSLFLDVELCGFRTAGMVKWLPSLLVPGLGTYKMGARSNVCGRAIPFYLFGALSVAGFMLEKHNGPDAPSITSSGDHQLWECKNVGKIAGIASLSVSGIIYLTEIIDGLSYSSRNYRYSKQLRKQLKSAPILLQTQDIIIDY